MTEEKPKKRFPVALLVGVALSIAVVVVLATSLDLKTTAKVLADAPKGWLVPAALLYLAIFPIRGLRWSFLLRGVAKPPIGARTATEVFAIGFVANNVLPARLGDVARAFVLKTHSGMRATAALSSVVLERIFDGLTVVGMLAAVLTFAPPDAGWVVDLGWIMGALFVVALSVAFALAFRPDFALRIAALCLRPAPERLRAKILHLLEGLAHGFQSLRSARTVAIAVVLSIVIWSAEVGVYALLQPAFGLELSWPALTLTMCVLTLGLTAPSSPAFVGVFEGLVVSSLSLYRLDPAVSFAFAIALHAVHFTTGSLFGLVSAGRYGLKFRDLSRAGRAIAEEGAPDSEPLSRNRAWT